MVKCEKCKHWVVKVMSVPRNGKIDTMCENCKNLFMQRNNLTIEDIECELGRIRKADRENREWMEKRK